MLFLLYLIVLKINNLFIHLCYSQILNILTGIECTVERIFYHRVPRTVRQSQNNHVVHSSFCTRHLQYLQLRDTTSVNPASQDLYEFQDMTKYKFRMCRKFWSWLWIFRRTSKSSISLAALANLTDRSSTEKYALGLESQDGIHVVKEW